MRLIITVLSIALLGPASAEWNQWRGEGRDGKSSETGLLRTWPDGGPELVWRSDSLGAGYSSLAAAGGMLFTQGFREGRQLLIALDAETGDTVWETAHGGSNSQSRAEGRRGGGGGARV